MRGAHNEEAESGSNDSSGGKGSTNSATCTDCGQGTVSTESAPNAASSAPAQALRMVRAPEIPESEIILGPVLGRGGAGTVRAGTWLSMPVAVKRLDERTIADAQQRWNLEQEAAILASLRHPCVCQFFGTCLAGDGLAVVMELLDCSLHQLLAAPSEHVSATLAYRIAHETAQGIAFLHRNHVLHRDIKPGNVVLDQLKHAKVCDFGLSRAFTVSVEPGMAIAAGGLGEQVENPSGTTCCVGTLRYMAPEVMRKTEQEVTIRYSKPCDVYSFGMLLWELAHRQQPFAGSPGINVALTIVPAGLRPELRLPKDLAALGPLVTSCWHADPAQRPTISACCEQLLALFQGAGSRSASPALVTPEESTSSSNPTTSPAESL